MQYDQPHIQIEKALLQSDPVKHLIELLKTKDTCVEAALNLAEMADQRAVVPIFKQFKINQEEALSHALTHLNCAAIAREILELSLSVKKESQAHFLEILNGSVFSEQKAKILKVRLDKLRAVESISKVRGITNKRFLQCVQIHATILRPVVKPHNNVIKISNFNA